MVFIENKSENAITDWLLSGFNRKKKKKWMSMMDSETCKIAKISMLAKDTIYNTSMTSDR